MSSGTHWLSIVGIGEDGYEGLSTEAKAAIASAEILYGGDRHLAFIPAQAGSAVRVCWPSPMVSAVQHILKEDRGQRRVTVLASGDPMLYGVGVWLTSGLPVSEFRVIPQVSSYALACARMGWAAADTQLVSLVNRPVEQVIRYLQHGQRLVFLSEDGSTPSRVAEMLVRLGYSQSLMAVFENLGGASEKAMTQTASEWTNKLCGKLNVVAMECIAGRDAKQFPHVAGLPDDAFETDGQITKREVRTMTIARLAPLPKQMLWDVGAGSGSVGIEWMRAHPSCSCIAFEMRQDRALRIRENALRLGVPMLKVVLGKAPEIFAELQRPNAVFVGGDVSNDGLFYACWNKLLPGGRLVANAVTLGGEASLAARHALYGGELTRISIARASAIGDGHAWRPMMPITQWAVEKP